MFKRKISLLLALVIFISAVFPIASVDASQAGTVYYIDSELGDDLANDGLTPSAPWKSFSKVNSSVFQPGDQILLKCNGVWNEQLYPKGSGTAESPITISSYGEGSKPLIALQGQNLEGADTGIIANACVYLRNQSNWIIQNLEVTNFSTEPRSEIYRFGINVDNVDGGVVSNIQILNNSVHDVSGSFYWQDHSEIKLYAGPHCNGGISVSVRGATGTDKVDNILIQGNTVKNVGRTGIVVWDDLWNDIDYASTNVKISQNYVEKSDSDGILTFGCNGAILEYNVANGCGNYTEEGQFNGTCAIWSTRGADCISQFNEAYNTRSSELNEDGQAFDIDMDSSNFVVQYNYSHDNEGGFILVVDATGAPGVYNGTINPVVRYNISQNDRRRIINIAGGIASNLQFYNNTIFVGEGLSTNLIDHSWDIDMSRAYFFKNNIFYNLGSGSYNIPGSNGTFDYNLYYGNHPASEPNEAHKLTNNPLFENPGTGNIGLSTVDGYRLASNSPAIGSGVLISNNGGQDYWGNSVSAVNAPNRGAYNGAGGAEIPEKVVALENAIAAISGLPTVENLTLFHWYAVETARLLVDEAKLKGALDEDIINLSALVLIEGRMIELKAENAVMRIVDDFNDTSKILSYEGPLNINIYGSHEGDTAQLYCAAGATGSIVYNANGLHDFSARLYYFTEDAIPDGIYENVIRFYVSKDNSNWVQVIPEKSLVTTLPDPAWKGITFTVPELTEEEADANYLKIQIINAGPVDWIYLLGHVSYNIKLAAPGSFELLGPVNGALYQSINPLLSWNLAAGADVYRVLIDNNADFASPEFDKTVSGDISSFQAYGLSYDETYYWKIIARNAVGNTEASTVKSFTTNPEQADQYIDSFSDFGKISDIDTDKWTISTDSSDVYFEGDSDRIVKNPNNITCSFIYFIDELAGENSELCAFSSRIYYCSYGGPDNMENKNIKFYISPDNVNWTQLQTENNANVNTSGAWYRTDIEEFSIPEGIKYLKLEVIDRDEGNWAIQIGNVRLTTVPVFLEDLKVVIQAISALPSFDALTLQDKTCIENVRALVNAVKEKGALDSDITNLSILLMAENKINSLLLSTPTPAPSETPKTSSTPTPAITSTITVKTVQKGTVAEGEVDINTLSKAFEAAASDNGVKKVTLELVAIEGVRDYQQILPASLFNTKEEAGVSRFITIKTPVGTIEIPAGMFKKSDIDKAQQVGISIKVSDGSALELEFKNRIGSRPVIEPKVTVDGKLISWKNNDSPVTLTVDYTPTSQEKNNPESIVIWHIDSNGKAWPIPNARYEPKADKISFKTTHFSAFAVAFEKKNFSDMNNHTWAKNSSELLVSKGIMEQASENIFSPGTSITRGEFIEALVKALDLHVDYDSNFTDINLSDKCYDSVAIARKLGIASGYNNMFNPDMEITRQDMAVLVYKALSLCKKISAEGNAGDIQNFSDASKVSGYAVNAMSTLVVEDIIKGTGVNLNPLEYTSKAEASVVIYKVYNK